MTPAEAGYLGLLIDFALTEDLSDDGDVTSRATIPDGLQGPGRVRRPRAGVLAGHRGRRAQSACGSIRSSSSPPRGRTATGSAANETLATVAGPMRSILMAERTALNFLQRLSRRRHA